MEYAWLLSTLTLVVAFTVLWLETRRNGWTYLLLAASTVLNIAPRLPGGQHLPATARIAISVAAIACAFAALGLIISGRARRRARSG